MLYTRARFLISLFLSFTWSFVLACDNSDESLLQLETSLTGNVGNELPELPTIQRNVAPIQNGQFIGDHLPPLRTSADGRIALNMVTHNNVLRFHLNVPEKITGSVLDSGGGVSILSDITPYTDPNQPPASGHSSGLGQELFHDVPASLQVPGTNVTHATLCDGTTDESEASTRTNPYACGHRDAADCYDLTVVAAFAFGINHPQYPGKSQLWGTPITIMVDRPKDAQASLTTIQIGTPVGGPIFDGNAMFEPMVTKDGRLLVARLAGTTFSWPDESGNQQSGRYDLVYSVAPPSASACDVTQWDQFYPMSHAPYHSQMKGRYGIAEYPFLDPEGSPVPDGEDLQVSYPWVDRDGDNILFTSIISTLHYMTPTGTSTVRYPVKCLPAYESSCTHPQNLLETTLIEGGGFTRGIGVAGLWTHGKMIVLDNIINNTDYALKNADILQRLAKLYQADPQTTDPNSGWIRIGSGRDNSIFGAPPGFSRNTNITDSYEHLFNFNPNLHPQTVRDVVWILNAGRSSAEVAFDDYVNPNAFLIAEMGASFSHGQGNIPTGMRYNDGFTIINHYVGQGKDGQTPVRLQNTATATIGRWNIPSYGDVTNGRIEPVALGGIEGKGFWMDGRTQVRFSVGPQPTSPKNSDWFIGLFIDPRALNNASPQRLLTFPDGTAISIKGTRNILISGSDGSILKKFWLPTNLSLETQKWMHLGFEVPKGGKQVRLYVNGLRLRTWNTKPAIGVSRVLAGPSTSPHPTPTIAKINNPVLQIEEGEIILGAVNPDSQEGFVGWVDELKIFAERPGPELACNYARGTLIEVTLGAAQLWQDIADAHPDKTHQEIRQLINGSDASQYACFVDYTQDGGVSLKKIPSGTLSVRKAIIFPEGQFQFGQPRPDSSQNVFCKTCHVDTHPSSLGLEALVEKLSLALENDLRRQPMQHNRRMYGHIPADLFSAGMPMTPLIAPQLGEQIDQWIFP